MGSSRTRARAHLVADLAPRRQPAQERARKTVKLILDTAATLLGEHGVEAFNTNILAERAGLRIRTVYRYFPNKLAVMAALAERMAEEWGAWNDGFRSLSDPGTDWKVAAAAYVDIFADGIRRTPGGLAVRRAMRALPELQEFDRRDNERVARELAAAIERRGVAVPRSRLTIMARVLIETGVTVLDLALLGPPTRERALIEELKRLHLAYLEAFMEGRPTAPSSPRRRAG